MYCHSENRPVRLASMDGNEDFDRIHLIAVQTMLQQSSSMIAKNNTNNLSSAFAIKHQEEMRFLYFFQFVLHNVTCVSVNIVVMM